MIAAQRVLVTGHRGHVGRFVVAALENRGHEVVGFDIKDGGDVLDGESLIDAASRCSAVIHLALHPGPASMDVVIDRGIVAFTNVLDAAARCGAGRVVVASSVRALGCFPWEGRLAYLPIDDAHPAAPTSGYAVLKRIIEHQAERAASSRDAAVICLRPPAVYDDAMAAAVAERDDPDEQGEWSPRAQYGAWIHGADVGAAFAEAISCPAPSRRFAAVLVAADDSNSRFPYRELIRRTCPGVEWRGGSEYRHDPFRSLVESEPARRLLRWVPGVRWAGPRVM